MRTAQPVITSRESLAIQALLDLGAGLMGQDLSTDQALITVLEQIRQILDASDWSIYLLPTNGDTSCLEVRTAGDDGWDSRQLQLAEADLVTSTFQESKAIFTKDTAGRPVACLPIPLMGQITGAIVFSWDAGVETEKVSLELLAATGRLVGGVLESARRSQKIQARIAELELRQKQLLTSRNTLRALFDNSPTAMYIIDRDYNLLAVNRQRADQIGQPPQALVNNHCYQALYSLSEPCPECRVFESLTYGSVTRRVDRRPLPDGGTREIETRTFPIRDETGQPVQAFLFEEDITERIRLQEQLAQADKLVMTGQLAAGVAHEINNPLTVIMANAQLLQRRLSSRERELTEMVELIIQAGERASQAVRDLLDFARRERFEVSEVDINASLRRILGLVRHELIANSIDLVFLPDDHLPAVIASQDHLEGVWLNLLLNAVDAIHPGPGNIRVATRQAAGQVQVVIADNGRGIEPEQLPHIFDPFFTTKGRGRGTGLGLSICQQIIARHGGEIRVYSQTGAGTQFTIVLPLSNGEPLPQ